MIKTLRITSVAAVLLAAVVLASVLGLLQPASLLRLNLAVRTDKQTEKILSGPSAVDRFKEQYRNKVPTGQDTTPPLIKQAELFARIINPPAPEGAPVPAAAKMPLKPTLSPKPAGPVSTKFDLLGTCYSSADPKTSFAYIRLPDNTTQWIGVGSAIGHVTIKEIRNGSIVYSDGKGDAEMNTLPTPETSSLLETGKGAKEAASVASQTPSEPQTSSRTPSVKPPVSSTARNAPARPINPSVTPGRAATFGVPTPSAQISKEEQASLSELGNKLKAAAGADANGTASQTGAEPTPSLGIPPQAGSVPNPTQPGDAYKGSWKDTVKEETRRQLIQKRLTVPRSQKK